MAKVNPQVGYLDVQEWPDHNIGLKYGDIVQLGTRYRNWYERIIAGISWLACPKEVGFLTYVKYKPFYCRIVGVE